MLPWLTLWSVFWLLLLAGCASSGPITRNDQSYQLSSFEAAVVRETNLARTQPSQYRTFLQQTRRYYAGKLLKRPDKPVLLTQEGVQAADAAIRFLSTVRPVPPLQVSKGLSLAARDHALDQKKYGSVGHTGRGGSEVWDRANRYGRWLGAIGENIAYGQETAREVVMSLIIDDGVPDRGHRDNMFSTDYRLIGVACGSHQSYRTLCVITLAGGYSEKAERHIASPSVHWATR
jgi:uncharacterized protein YkwD